jgi:hypothetical protein
MNASQKKSCPLVVELIGLPGVGKTTLVQGLASVMHQGKPTFLDRMQFNQWSARQPRLKRWSWMVIHFWELLRALFWGGLFCISFERKDRASFARLIRPLRMLMFQRMFCSDDSRGYLLLDQAIVQQIWSISVFSNRFNQCLLRKYLSSFTGELKENTLYVFIQSTPGLASERVSHRDNGDSRFESLDVLEREKLFIEGAEVMGILIEILERLGCRVMRLNAEDDVAIKVKQLQSALGSIFR